MRGRKQHEYSSMGASRARDILKLASCVRVILVWALLFPSLLLPYAQGQDTDTPGGPEPQAPKNAIIERGQSPPPPDQTFRPGSPSQSDGGIAPQPSSSHPEHSERGPGVAPSPTSSPSSPESGGGLTSGAKAGLGLISVAGLLQVVVFIFLMARRRQLLRDLNDPADWRPARDL